MAISSTLQQYSKSREVKSIAIYTFSNFFNKGVSFLLLFYFTQVLSEADFGMLSLFSNSILFAMPFISMGILQSVNADFFKLGKKEFKDFFSTSFLLPIAVTLLSITVLLLFKNQLKTSYNFPAVFIAIIPVAALLSFIQEELTILVRNNNQPIQYLWVNITRLLLEIILAVFLISALHYGWMGRVMGMLVSYFLTAIYAIYYFTKNGYLSGSIRKQYIKIELQYSTPIITMQVGVFCLSSSAVYYISHFTHSLQEVGIYSVAATFASIVNVFCVALLQYVQPKMYVLLSQKITDYRAIKKLFIFYVGLMALFTIAVISTVPLVYHLLLKQTYLPGLQYCYLLCTGHFFWSITYFFFSLLLYEKQKKKIGLLSLIAVAISITANWFFTGKYGGTGAAIATVSSYGCIMAISYIFVYRKIETILQSKVSLPQH